MSENTVDFASNMVNLGENIHPRESEKSCLNWLRTISYDGYVLKRHALKSEAETLFLLRGPLITTLSTLKKEREEIKAFSLYEEVLDYEDEATARAEISDSLAISLTQGTAYTMTEYIDQVELACDDDVLRRAIKGCINEYIPTAVDGVKPQVPRWGFFMSSVVVSAFPDLKAEAPLPKEANPSAKEIIDMQTLVPDVLICPPDRLPDHGTLNQVISSQPHHQQGYQLGISLTPLELDVIHRAIPKTPGCIVDPPTASQKSSSKDGAKVYATIFETPMPRPDVYMSKYFSTAQSGYLNESIGAGTGALALVDFLRGPGAQFLRHVADRLPKELPALAVAFSERRIESQKPIGAQSAGFSISY
ncbi:hypothetical protein F4777DRAFT_580969 [Nemania sp. FL0916]|nr:hypothetical protein F4777DRAFT_580969 [Nemania sp. FL0916]